MGKLKRSTLGTMKTKAARPPSAQVVQLDEFRRAHHREHTERRVRRVLEENRAALRRLFASGLIFTQKGSRAGRDLLSAQLALLKLIDLISRMIEDGPVSEHSIETFAQIDAQLERTSHLTARTGEFLAGRGSD